MSARFAVLAHSAAGLAFFLGFVFMPRILPALAGQRLFLWICVLGGILAFVMTNLAGRRATRSGSGQA
jgi:hypothetical protein